MRTFLIALALLTAAHAADLDGVELISTGTYDPRREQGREFKAIFSDIGLFFAGASTDLTKIIREKLEKPELRTYFPDAKERARIARQISDDTQSRYLSNGYNNSSVTKALRNVTSRLVTTVVQRVLIKEGVKESARAAAWADKILGPYDRCVARVRSYQEGTKCGESLERDLLKNIGLALSYELTQQEFGAQAARPAAYKKCLRPQDKGSDQRVRDCALQGVRVAASDFGRARILAEAKRKMPEERAKYVVDHVMPDFDRCLKAAKERGGFTGCGDRLLASAGAAIAGESIRSDARLAPLPKAQRDKLAERGHDAFVTCLNENRENNRRDEKGSLRTDNCESFVTLETAHAVAEETFTQSVSAALTGAPAAERARIVAQAKKQLAECWNSRKEERDNNECLRGAARDLAVAVADKRLANEIPADAQSPELKQRLLGRFGDCLDQKLPADMLHGEGADAAANGCAAEALRAAAGTVAEQKVRKALAGKVADQSTVDQIVNTFVREDFPACLGESPSSATLAGCSLKLQKNVAMQATVTLLAPRLDDFLKAGGGMESYHLDAEGRRKLLDGVLHTQKLCLKKEVKSLEPEKTGLEVDDCFKKTIRDLTLRLAGLEFAKAARANDVDVSTAVYRQVSQDFTDGFGVCLDKKRERKFSLDDYLKNLDACRNEITKATTSEMAKKELSQTVRDTLGNEGEPVRQRLSAAFDACIARPDRSADACVTDLRAEATVTLATHGVHNRARKELNVTEMPASIQALDAGLKACVAEKKDQAGECGASYVKAATIDLGQRMIEEQIVAQLPPEKLASARAKMASVVDPLRECVNKVPGPLNKKMLAALEACANDRTEAVMVFILERMAEEIGPPESPVGAANATMTAAASEAELADKLTRTVLCLNGNLDPDQERALQNLEPNSLEAGLLGLLGRSIGYDLAHSQKTLDSVFTEVADELKAAGPEAARRKLLLALTQKGLADQMLKALVRRDVEKLVAGLPDGQKAAAAKLTDKAHLNQALDQEMLDHLRPRFVAGVLDPVLVQGKSLRSSAVLRASKKARVEAVEALLTVSDLDGDLREALRAAVRK